MSRTSFTHDITTVASVHGLDPDLVEALIIIESSGNPDAWNPEPRYRYLWNVRTRQPFRTLTPEEILSEAAPTDFPSLAGDRDQEWWGQAASWGLMQIMGAVARERGFLGPYLTALCKPHVNIQLGCAHLADLLRWAQGNQGKALGAYNVGRGGALGPVGQAYAGKVLAMRAQIHTL